MSELIKTVNDHPFASLAIAFWVYLFLDIMFNSKKQK